MALVCVSTAGRDERIPGQQGRILDGGCLQGMSALSLLQFYMYIYKGSDDETLYGIGCSTLVQ